MDLKSTGKTKEEIKEMYNTNETVTAMYPLLTPSVDAINEQLQITGDLDSVTYASDNQYTTLLILEAARQAAQSARIDTN